MAAYTHILFDLDGTLTDSLAGISNCFRHALDRVAYDYRHIGNWNWIVGPPLLESFEQLLGPEAAPLAVEYYRERYSVTGWLENSVYDGIPELLAGLRGRGVRLYLATAKPEEFALKILRHFQLLEYFSGVAGAMMHHRRHKDEVFSYAMSEFAIPGKSALMVGDRSEDILAARRHGVRAAGVLYGFGGRDELAAASPELLAATVRELEAKLNA